MKILPAIAILAFALSATARQDKPAPTPDQHHQGVNERGDHVMGFSHEKTTHHFLLLKDGGVIDVSANDAKDTASRDQIRMHLGHIAETFSAGDFEAPMLIHGLNPPGVATMKALREQIKFKYDDSDRGGRLRITSKNAKALDAIHEFLRFQIKDHQTGDSIDISPNVK